jgi:hypothetical protein
MTKSIIDLYRAISEVKVVSSGDVFVQNGLTSIPVVNIRVINNNLYLYLTDDVISDIKLEEEQSDEE